MDQDGPVQMRAAPSSDGLRMPREEEVATEWQPSVAHPSPAAAHPQFQQMANATPAQITNDPNNASLIQQRPTANDGIPPLAPLANPPSPMRFAPAAGPTAVPSPAAAHNPDPQQFQRMAAAAAAQITNDPNDASPIQQQPTANDGIPPLAPLANPPILTRFAPAAGPAAAPSPAAAHNPDPQQFQRMAAAAAAAQITNDPNDASPIQQQPTANDGIPPLAPLAHPLSPMRFAPAAGSGGAAVVAAAPYPPPWASFPAGAMADLWQCHKCKRDNLASKARCSSCQAWRGGRREGYGKRKAASAWLATHYGPPPAPSWTCPCGNENAAAKVRCAVCQKWRGGRRPKPGGASSAHGRRAAPAAASLRPPQGPWACDRCGNANEGTKVRCAVCPRWRDGRRPGYGRKAVKTEPASTGDVGSSLGQPIKTETGQPIKMEAQQPIKMEAQQQLHHATAATAATPGTNWFCMGCNQLNAAKKTRCGSCQRWKFGKRENMLKKNRPAPSHAVKAEPVQRQGPPATAVQTTTAGVGLRSAADAFAPLAGVPQHPPEGNPAQNLLVVPVMPQPRPELDTLQPQIWSCICGHTNVGKHRCSSCHGWKGGKRGSLTRRLPKQESGAVAALCAGVAFPEVARMMPNQPNMPWKCTKCGEDNGCNKLRCRTCQSWKNARKQLRPKVEAVAAWIAAKSDPATSAPVAAHRQRVPPSQDGVLHAPWWECHRCKARVTGTKNRCSGCKGWKGGVRHNIGKKAGGDKATTPPWGCISCGKQNGGNRVRCAACQGWRGGGRPDVAARRAIEQALNGGTWSCDRCQRPNKLSKVRCGGCQRWRGGCRPDMRKSAKSRQKATVPNNGSSQPYQLPNSGHVTMKHPIAQLPPAQLLPLRMPTAFNNQPVAPLHAPPCQSPMNAPNAAVNVGAPVQNQIRIENLHQNLALSPVSQVVLMAQASSAGMVGVVPKTNSIGAWTCTKCTCDNMATEMKCKICDSTRDGWC